MVYEQLGVVAATARATMAKTAGSIRRRSRELAIVTERHQRRVGVVRTGACVLRQRVGMRRSGALTLSGPDAWRGNRRPGAESFGFRRPGWTGGSSTSFDGFALPALPQNWADLPCETDRFRNPSRTTAISLRFQWLCVALGDAHGDFISTSMLAFSSKANGTDQQFFLDTSFGVIRYLHQVDFNSNHIFASTLAVNWVLLAMLRSA